MLKKIVSVSLALLLSVAFAHATVKTESGATESLAGKSETYRLQVPVEKDSATTQIRMLIPDGVKITRFLQLPGWTRTMEKDANGRVTSVTWTGNLEPMEFARFFFSATNPAGTGTLSWKVYQTYADGTTVAWDDSSADTPASKTTLK
ncbi:DUF1775 domain-containing protein [Deinococcus cellulosilyticus]|uniref:YncI copper-binding domain-containing protein n=1 Tax=Deinococcus cellulosilyticus (strain DSM 18568 / NBRC 106333 / KACC 11606 / 5516J-15) TaxID=1223518 RepID=A0A511N4R5_DEIC1|nr:DUF1775 domain-containing protein [Deinococcus cellulosilyticus]GEM47853.1 hypothetical protein DC3_34880 [Deinococcus cellulosilyticus NBRC 106333 = KACC 11606]